MIGGEDWALLTFLRTASMRSKHPYYECLFTWCVEKPSQSLLNKHSISCFPPFYYCQTEERIWAVRPLGIHRKWWNERGRERSAPCQADASVTVLHVVDYAHTFSLTECIQLQTICPCRLFGRTTGTAGWLPARAPFRSARRPDWVHQNGKSGRLSSLSRTLASV